MTEHSMITVYRYSMNEWYRNHNRKLQTSKALLKSQAQGTSLFTSAASNQRGFPKNSQWEAQVRLPEGERRQIRRWGGCSLGEGWGERGSGEYVLSSDSTLCGPGPHIAEAGLANLKALKAKAKT